MPFVTPTQEGVLNRRTRGLIFGGPNRRKTTALLTTPAPRAIFGLPGEKGQDTVPLDDPDTDSFVWEIDHTSKAVDSGQIVADVERAILAAIVSQRYQSICPDGLHKFYDYILDMVTGGAFFEGVEFDPKMYGMASRRFNDFLSKVMHSHAPVVFMTCWDADEPDRKKKGGERPSDIPSHLYPALPGQAAKKIVGEFSVVVHADIKKLKPTDEEAVGTWQTRPYGDVWGASIKGPTRIVSKIPLYIPADYRYFTAMWDHLDSQTKETA